MSQEPTGDTASKRLLVSLADHPEPEVTAGVVWPVRGQGMIVAFLQNMWLRDPSRHLRFMQRANHKACLAFRRNLQKYALFAGCLTGRRLREAFGDTCEQIIWEEASLVVADNPRDYHPPDIDHIRAVLAEQPWKAVLCLTKRGEKIIKTLVDGMPGLPFISSPHPAARNVDMSALTRAAIECRKYL